jgi:ArsR family metal-binding transcriptional regulator
MLIKDTLLTVVLPDIIEYTIPLLNEYNWSLRNTSEVRVSEDCVASSKFETVRVSIVAKVESTFPDTFIFVASIFPDVSVYPRYCNVLNCC